MRPQRQASCAARRAPLAAAVALAAFGAPALADGVVVSSSSPRFSSGDRIANGRQISLEDGERLSIIDPGGDVHRLNPPGGTYRDDGDGEGRRGRISQRVFGAAGQVLAGAAEGERLGATRGENFCDDEELAPARSVACGADAPEARFEAMLADEDARLQPGDPLQFILDATVDLEVLCEVGLEDGSWKPAAGEFESGPIRLYPRVRRVAPRRGAVSGALPAPGDAAILRCYGVDPQSWELLEPNLPDDAGADAVFTTAAMFADARGGVFLQTRIGFELVAGEE